MSLSPHYGSSGEARLVEPTPRDALHKIKEQEAKKVIHINQGRIRVQAAVRLFVMFPAFHPSPSLFPDHHTPREEAHSNTALEIPTDAAYSLEW